VLLALPSTGETPVPPILCFSTLFASFPFRLFCLIFLAALLGLLAAEFPDDAAGAEFAIDAGVGAGPAFIQALLAVAVLHLLAQDAGVPLRVMAAFIHKFHKKYHIKNDNQVK
jgi:hypothetical protein